MKKILLLGLSAFALAACDGSSISTFGPNDGTGDPIVDDDTPLLGGPDVCSGAIVCSGDVRDVNYLSDSDTLRITGTPFDEEPILATYVRADLVNNSSLPGYSYNYASATVGGEAADVFGPAQPAFAAYENDDPLALKPYLAIYRTSADGSISVGQVSIMDGYRDYGYNGYFYIRNDTGSIPTEELALYSGNYAGIIALAGDDEAASNTYLSAGRVNFEVDFTDGYISGYTSNRRIVADETGASADIALKDIVFDDDTFTGGAFAGTSTTVGDGDDNWSGGYQGFFGGTQANTLGGVFVVETSDFFQDDVINDEFTVSARETGTFLATKDVRIANPRPAD